MKKIFAVLLVLVLVCSMLPVSALAAYDRTKPPCQEPGHEKNDGMDHNRPKPCWVTGHFACDGLDHERAACGIWKHFGCDGKTHEPAACGVEGHFACKGKHEPAACGVEGHYACDGGKHNGEEYKYCNAEVKHKKCETKTDHFCDPENGGCGETYPCKESSKHVVCEMCGRLWCDTSMGDHYSPCGNKNHRQCYYNLQGKKWRASDHPKCHLCGGGKCTGKHGVGACVALCNQCGEVLEEGESHRGACDKHFTCITKGKHTWCDKHYMYKCDSAHPAH